MQGLVRIMKKRLKGTMSRHQEEYREKVKLEETVWAFLAQKFTNKP